MPKVYSSKNIDKKSLELVIKAPIQANKYKPGQFYKLQNYEINRESVNGTRLSMEGLALFPSLVDKEKGLITFTVEQIGASTRLAKFLKEGERVMLMGPTGSAMDIPENESIIVISENYNNPSANFICDILNQNNNVVHISDYSDVIESFRAFINNNSEAKSTDRIIIFAKPETMTIFQNDFRKELNTFFKKDIKIIVAVNSTMQCMMKEICSQCLQKQIEPVTKKEYFIFSCANQFQELDYVDISNLKSRLESNSLHEKISDQWVDYLTNTVVR